MKVLLNLSALALKEVAHGACKAHGLTPAFEVAVRVTGMLATHFKDQSGRLTKALRTSNQRAWQTLELALAGDSFWDRCKSFMASGDDHRFKKEMQAHLKSLTFPEGDSEKFRRICRAELRAARKEGLLDSDHLDPEALARRAGGLARYAEPSELLAAESDLLTEIRTTIHQAKYESLARLIELQPRPDTALITVAVRYFFRRCVEDDPKLFQGLAFAQLEQIQQAQGQQFDAIREQFSAVTLLIDQRGDELETLLGDIQADVFATYNAVKDMQEDQKRLLGDSEHVRTAVLDVAEEQKRLAGQNDDIYKAVMQLQNRMDMVRTELRPRDSLSIRGDVERQLVRELVARYRMLPEDQRRDMPALLNAVGKLQVATGDFQSAGKDFAIVAELVNDSPAKAEAHFNAYRAALERRDWESALNELKDAVKLNAARFEPFPFRKYRPERILGAGGFGVAFLCYHQRVGTQVVVKTLTADDLDRNLLDVFAEARVLRQLGHDAIIGLRDCDFADDHQKRPYLEMDYFQSVSLDEWVKQNGPLTESDLDIVAKHMALGLREAHLNMVLHRDVKPGNVLVKRLPNGQWQVKLIDFGLALGLGQLAGSASSGTLRGSSIAGTLDFAAPEQMGKLPGVDVTPSSDVFGFGRTCCFALFGTPYPKAKHFDKLSPRWKNLLDDCVSDDPKERPANFDAVLTRLQTGAVPPTATPTAGGGATPAGSAWGKRATSWLKSAFSFSGPTAGASPPKPTESAPPKSDVLDVVAMPQPSSEGIEIVEEEMPEAIPVPKPKRRKP